MLKVSGLERSVDTDPLFTNVSFVLNDGDRVGLVGPNGTGKTTLLKIIAGEARPDQGTILLGSTDCVGYLRQEAAGRRGPVGDYLREAFGEVRRVELELQAIERRVIEGDTAPDVLDRYGAAQDRFAALDGWSMDEQIARVRARLDIEEIDVAIDIRELSGGQQARVMAAAALIHEPTILLLDEPTNHLDLEGVLWLEEFLRDFPGAVLMVSHDRRFLDRCVRQIFEHDGINEELQTYQGGYSVYRVEKQRRWQRWLLDYEAQEKERKKMQADIERLKRQAQSVESSTRNDHARRLAAKLAKKAKSRERMLQRQMKMATWIARPETRPQLTLRFNGGAPPGTGVIALTGASFRYGDTEVLHGVDLDVRGRDRCAMVGPNGSGKSTLLRLAHEHVQRRGDIPVGYLPQHHEHLPLDEPMLRFFRSRVRMDEGDARTLLDRFLFEAHQMRQTLRSLSSGERTRLVLASLVCSDAACLLLDEPTNHLDFDAFDVVTDALRAYRGTVVVVSHDRQFLRDIEVTNVVAIVGGRRDDEAAARLSRELLPAPTALTA